LTTQVNANNRAAVPQSWRLTRPSAKAATRHGAAPSIS
jgi:hypothetical protein